MPTALYTHPDCLGHVTPPGHPERVERLEAVLRALEDLPLDRREAPRVSREALLRCHPARYLDLVARSEPAPGQGWRSMDADTHMIAGTLAAAERAAGGVVAAVEAVVAGEVPNAFVAVRPPGHHAERETAMGFCFFGSVAVAALHAIEALGLSRVAIVDFDVHHGNGTQDLIWDREDVLFCSTHQMPLYPGTGAEHETGAHGQVVNVPLPGGADGAAFRAAIEDRVLPRLRAFTPDLLLISAGFDAHARDPLAGLNLVEADFAWVTGALCDAAEESCGGRVVSALEGGYDLEALAASARAHVEVLMERAG